VPVQAKIKRLQKFPPPASILAWGPGNKISLKIYNFSQKWAILKVIFVFTSWNIKELFKNSVRKKGDKKLQQKICYSPHPFSGKQHQNAPLSDTVSLWLIVKQRTLVQIFIQVIKKNIFLSFSLKEDT